MRVPHTLTWTYQGAWPDDVQHIADARTFVVTRLREHGLADAAVVLRLVVSELATNAVLHAATPFSVTLSRTHDSLRLVVRDGLAVSVPDPEPRAQTQPNGRGLGIVERLSTEWGVAVDGEGKSIWAVFELPVATPGHRRPR